MGPPIFERVTASLFRGNNVSLCHFLGKVRVGDFLLNYFGPSHPTPDLDDNLTAEGLFSIFLLSLTID